MNKLPLPSIVLKTTGGIYTTACDSLKIILNLEMVHYEWLRFKKSNLLYGRQYFDEKLKPKN